MHAKLKMKVKGDFTAISEFLNEKKLQGKKWFSIWAPAYHDASVLSPTKELDLKPQSSQLKGMGDSPIQNCRHCVPWNHSERKAMVRCIHSMTTHTSVLK